MTDKLRAAAQMALEALQYSFPTGKYEKELEAKHRAAIEALREASAEQPAPARKPLTDEQIQDAILPIDPHGMGYFLRIAHAIERAHGIT